MGALLPSLNPLTGKNEPNGTSIVDVTDPAHPVYLAHIPVGTTGNGGAQMNRVCPGSSLPIKNNKYYLLRSYANSAHEIWDVTDPSHPVGVRTVAGNNPVVGNLTGRIRAGGNVIRGLPTSWGDAQATIQNGGRATT